VEDVSNILKEGHPLEPVQDPNTLEIYNIPPNCSSSDLILKFSSIGEINKFIITDPIPTHNFVRFAWLTYNTYGSFSEALTTLKQDLESWNNINVKEHVSRIKIKYSNITPNLDENRMPKELDCIKKN